MADKYLSGWRYGEIHNNELKLRANFIPYDDPEEEKEKDRSAVRDLARNLNASGSASFAPTSGGLGEDS